MKSNKQIKHTDINCVIIPRHTLVSGYYVIPFGVCPSVRPSVRPCSPFPIDNLSIYSPKFFKFCIHIVIGNEWYGIVNVQNPSVFYCPFSYWKNGFWPVILLLFMISEWNFTDMLHIKGYILWLRTVTLTIPVCELSALDRSEKRFLTYCSFTIWNIWT